MMNISRFSVLLLISLLILIGVWLSHGDWIYPEQPQSPYLVQSTILGQNTIGQTFVASQAGLMGLELKVHPISPTTQAVLTLQIRTSPTETQNIRQISMTTPINDGAWIRFDFDPIVTSRSTYYYFLLTSDQPISLFHGTPESYPDGALYLNGQPQPAQLAFHAIYNRFDILWELFQNFILNLPIYIITFSTFLFAGWAFLILSQAHETLITNWVEGLIVAIGLSLAWYPLLLLWTDTLGLHLGQNYIWLTLIISLAILIRYYYDKKPTLEAIYNWLNSPDRWADLALFIVIIIATLGRVLMARRLDMPLWDDSVHHTIMVQRILETGGLFQSWQPYTPYETLSFHFGFHTNMAVLAWATGFNAAQAIIWGGQWINLFAALSLYPLAYRWQGRWAGVLTVLLISLFTNLPLHYVNWGRYAQLMGQALLPLACWWTVAVLMQKQLSWQKQFLLWLGGALLIFGSVISYYRMAFHYLAFLMAIWLVYFPNIKTACHWRNWLPVVSTLLLTVILSSSWFIHLGTLHNLGPPKSSPVQPDKIDRFWQQIQTYQSDVLTTYLLVFLIGTLLVIWGGRKFAIPLAWLWLLVTLPLLRLLPLPGVMIIQEFTLNISLYMLQGIILGMAGGWLIDKTIGHYSPSSIFLVIVISLMAGFKLPDLPEVADREFDLSTRPDLRAATWITQNLPSQALLLINGMVYEGQSALATDAGSWLPLLTHREVTIPPQYALLGERSTRSGYSLAVNNLTKALEEQAINNSFDKMTLCQFPQPITHVYIGQKRGMVTKAIPNAPAKPMLSPEVLQQDPAFKLIYQQDRVLIFEFNRAICP